MFDPHALKQIGTTSSSIYASAGGLPTFDAVPFRVIPGENPVLGSFVLIGREKEPLLYHYGRIVEGSEYNPRAEPARIQADETFGMPEEEIRPSEASPELVRTMRVEVLGEVSFSGGEIRITEPRSLPQTGQPVYGLPARFIPALLGTPYPPAGPKERPPEGALYIGQIESGGETVDFYLPNGLLARHIAVVGKTGVGKSYAAGVLIEEAVSQDIPVIAFDILGDTAPTADELGGINLRAGDDNFKVPYSIVGHEEFRDFFPLTTDQQDWVYRAYDVVYTEALRALDAGEIPEIPLDELLTELKQIGEAANSTAARNAVPRIRYGFDRSVLLTERAVEWPYFLEKYPVVNVYVGHLDQRQRNLVVGSAARILQRFRRHDRIPPFLLVLDEAHLFLPGGGEATPSTRVIREMIRTARHDFISVVLLTQSPSSMDRQVLLTCNTRIVFALDPDDQKVIAGQMGDLPEVVLNRLPRLARGTAVVASAMDLLRHHVLIHIRKRRTRHAAETPKLSEEVKRWKESHRKRARI